jgi:hypothetical protein
MVKRLIKFFSSLRLTVALLVLGLLLVFVGTLAQVNEGLYQAQTRYFKSFVIWWATPSGLKVPVMPGGYTLGTLLLINLITAHAMRFKFVWKKAGILLIHSGLILLLLGQLLTDVFSTESAMRLAEGDSKNYSEDFHENELVVINASNPQQDEVISIPETLLAKQREIRHEKLPVTLRVKGFWPNSSLFESEVSNSIPVKATQGIGRGLYLLPLKPIVSMDDRNLPSALIEIIGSQGSLGTWLVSSQTRSRQEFTSGGNTYRIAMRFTRHYKPFSLQLLEFRHEKYRGTEIPKNFQSRVRIDNPMTSEKREVDIYMNNPLRYAGETFYQAGFDENNDKLANKVTILQVVRNPSWLSPYLSCAIMAFGLIVQFLMHLIGFALKWRTL